MLSIGKIFSNKCTILMMDFVVLIGCYIYGMMWDCMETNSWFWYCRAGCNWAWLVLLVGLGMHRVMHPSRGPLTDWTREPLKYRIHPALPMARQVMAMYMSTLSTLRQEFQTLVSVSAMSSLCIKRQQCRKKWGT